MLSPEEIQAEAAAVAAVVDLLPVTVVDQVSKWSPVAGLVATTAMIVLPRMIYERNWYYAQRRGAQGPVSNPQPPAGGESAGPDFTSAFFPGAPVS